MDSSPVRLAHFIKNDKYLPSKNNVGWLPVATPHTNDIIAHVPLASSADVDAAVHAALEVYADWSHRTYKDRAQYLIKMHTVIESHLDELTALIVQEHGKTTVEAVAEIRKGLETLQYAMSLQNNPDVLGHIAEVSRGVTCRDERKSLGVVACIVPLNFPFMVPMWTIPIALACGNTVVLKPSEKVPMTMTRVAELLKDVFPPGVFNIVHGDKTAAQLLVAHPDVRAVTFVGTTAVARSISEAARSTNKRCLALGGAKNHLLALPDCDITMTARDVVNSFTGCSGQRCMAASVLLTIGPFSELLDKIIEFSKELQPGSGPRDIGPVIDEVAVTRINRYIDEAELNGATILLDGRKNAAFTSKRSETGGCWVGPTIILHHNQEDRAMKDEIFGPVLSIFECMTLEHAVAIENRSEYGNAAAVYTQSGAAAERVVSRLTAAMIGVNIGVPVPREPFSFGGTKASKFGDADITGDGGVEFFTTRRKVTTKWTVPREQSWLN
ncbi:methylmalonate-semialdehyde dehydrogenase [Ramicandelaber brevisporus]|nr:methylmalonate-semialdehyde dehydrogenase [Ramicandelaber brevisporus]KAI8868021.1 methylmalonate-semialdehyde dehydrogenase [Ramicandelaber brevisporus]